VRNSRHTNNIPASTISTNSTKNIPAASTLDQQHKKSLICTGPIQFSVDALIEYVHDLQNSIDTTIEDS